MTTLYQRDVALVEAAAKAVDTARFATAIRNVLEKYNVESSKFRMFGPPSYLISDQLRRSRNPPRWVVVGRASLTRHEYTLFAPGFARRRAQGFGLNLSTLEAMCHETAHTLSGQRMVEGEYRDEGAVYRASRCASGLVEWIFLDNVCASVTNLQLNEGLTQMLGLEFMREYLSLGWYMNTTKRDIECHFAKIRVWKPGTFYPEAVSYMEAIAERVGKGLGSVHDAYCKLLRAYLRAESILHDPLWKELLAECGVLETIRGARTAQYNELAGPTALIRSGHITLRAWEGVYLEGEANK